MTRIQDINKLCFLPGSLLPLKDGKYNYISLLKQGLINLGLSPIPPQDLPSASSLVGNEIVEIVQGGELVQATAQDIADLGGGSGAIGGSVNNVVKITSAGVTGNSNLTDDGTTVTSAVDLSLSDRLLMPNTTTSVGAIYFNGTRFIQNYNPPNADGGNVFIGRAGNVTMAWDGVNSYTAARNVAIGESAMLNNTTGYFNNAIGFEALKANTTGAGNAVLGSRALLANTTAHDNAAIGDNALYSNTTGYENQAVGYKALYLNTLGYHNVAIGYSAGYNVTEGFRNTFLGDETNVNSGIAATVNNSTAIGYSANITASNQIVLGNSSVTEVVTSGQISANLVGGNIRMKGAGTTANDGFAGVTGAGVIYFGNWDLSRGWQINADGTMRSLSTGAVGIGGASGTEKLNVTGSIGASGTINANSVGANFRMKADGTTAKDGGFFVSAGGDIFLCNWDGNRGFNIKSGGDIVTVGSGKLGVNTSTPTSQLQVVGIPEYANRTAALGAGLTAGAFYSLPISGDNKVICIV